VEHTLATQCHLAAWAGGYSSLQQRMQVVAVPASSSLRQQRMQLTCGAVSHEATLSYLPEHPSWRLIGSVAHAWSSTARRWLVDCAKLVGTAATTSTLLFCIKVIDDGPWHVAPSGLLPRSRLPCGRRVAGHLHRHSPRFEGEGGSEARTYRRESMVLVLGS
jgi:hypothetical protein